MLLGALAILAGLGWVAADLYHPRIAGDGVGLYAPLSSLFLDHDLNFSNEFAHSDGSIRRRWLTDPTGKFVSPYPVGAAILWFPPVAVAWILDPRKSSYGKPDSWQNSSPGFQKRYVLAVAIGTLLQTLAAGTLLLQMLKKHGVRLGNALLGVAAAILGTAILYYTLSMPSYAHSASFLASTALLFAALRPGTSRRSLVVLGALWSFVTLVRYQDAVLGILLVPRLWRDIKAYWPESRGELFLRVGLLLGAAILVFLPQYFYWQAVYGGALVSKTPILMNWTRPAVLAFLFSTWQGAVLWSPCLVLGVLGLLRYPDRAPRFALLAAVALEIYACSATADWWGSASCGARRLSSLAPIIGLGVGLGLEKGFLEKHNIRVLRYAAVIASIVWTVRLTQFYDAGFLPKNPGNPVDYERDYPPGDPHRKPWGLWDYGRFAGEVVASERRMWNL